MMMSQLIRAALSLVVTFWVTSVDAFSSFQKDQEFNSQSSIPVVEVQPRALYGFGTKQRLQNKFGAMRDFNDYAQWGLDWSRKISPYYRMSDQEPRNHVSSTSNSKSGLPSPANVYSDIYGRSGVTRPKSPGSISKILKPATMRFSGVPLHYSRYRNPQRHGNIYNFVSDRLVSGTTSSVSNGDNLSSFSHGLNQLEANYANKYENNGMQNNIFVRDNIDPLTMMIDEAEILNPQDITLENMIEYVPMITTMKPAVDSSRVQISTPARKNDNVIIEEISPISKLENQFVDEKIIVDENSIENDIQDNADKENNLIKQTRKSNNDHLFLSDFIDINKLIRNNVMNSRESENKKEGGKSFIKNQLSQNGQLKLINIDERDQGNLIDNNRETYLEVSEENLRNRGTKLKGSTSTYSSKYNAVGSFKNTNILGADNGPGLNIIGEQIAAMNRRGDVDSTPVIDTDAGVIQEDDITNTTDAENKQETDLEVKGSGKSRDNTDVNSVNIQSNKEKEEANVEDLLKLDYLTEPRWSTATKNLFKQLSEGYQSSPASYHLPTNAVGNYGSKVTGSTTVYTPYVQKYPGWANKEYQQYREVDPVTGAYKFGYGGPYQWRHEERRLDGVTFGGFGWIDEKGEEHVTRFIADRAGYRVLKPGQQIDFNVLPVYPPLPEQEGSESNSYKVTSLNKETFNTPKPLISDQNPINIPYPAGFIIPSRPSTPTIETSGYKIPGFVSPVKGGGTYSGNPFTSNQSVFNNISLTSANPFITPSVLSNLYQQVTQKYKGSKVSPNYHVGSNPLASFNPLGFPLPSQTFESNHPKYPTSHVSNITPDKYRPLLPFEYRGPVVNDYNSFVNKLINSENNINNWNSNSNNIGKPSPQTGKPVPTVRPPISLPLQESEQVSQPSSSSALNNNSIQSGNNSAAGPWTSSVIKVQTPPKSESLDYAFLTDDEPELGTPGNPLKSFNDIGQFLLKLMMSTPEGKLSITDVNQVDEEANSPSSGTDNNTSKNDSDKSRSELPTTNNDSSETETIGDYLGTVKWKIPVLGALDGIEQIYGPLHISEGNTPLTSHLADQQTAQKIEVTEQKKIDNDLPESNEANRSGVEDSREKTGISKQRRPAPPPPANFFSEFLKHLIMSRSDPSFRQSLQ